MTRKKEEKTAQKRGWTLRQTHLDLLFILFLCATALLLYLPTLHQPFHYDDYHNIVENPYIKNLKNIPLFLEGLRVNRVWFRAIPTFTFALNYRSHGLDVFGYHLVNLLLHIGSAILVYLLSKHLLSLRRSVKEEPAGEESPFYWTSLLSLFAALIFVVHPIQVNTVAYIVQRNEGLCAFFFLLSFFLFTKERAATGLPRLFLLAGVILAALAAIFSKEVGFTLPVILVLYDLIFICKNRKDLLGRLVFFGPPLLLISIYVLFFLQGGVLRLLVRGHGTWFWSPYQNLLTQAGVMIQYLKLLVWPWPGWLNIDHDIVISSSLFRVSTFLSVLAVLLALALAVFLARKRRLISFAIIWFFVILAPTSSLIPLWDVMVEYRLYLPMVAYGLILALLADFLHQLLVSHGSRKLGNGIVIGALIFLVAVYSAFTVQRSRAFRDGIALWEDAVLKSPNKARPFLSLGVMLHRSNRQKEAREMLEQALEKKPRRHPLVQYNLGVVYSDLGNYDKAIVHLGEYLKRNPADRDANHEMGSIYLRMGSLEKAGSYFRRALEISPHFAPAHAGLGDVLLKEGKIDEAISEYKKAVGLNPDLEKTHLRLAAAYLKKGMAAEAQFEMRQATTLGPGPDRYGVLGALYLQEDRLDQAVDLLEKALALDPKDPDVCNNLGVAYRKKGMLDDAIAQYRKAIELDPSLFDAHINLGEAYRAKKMTDEALREYRRAISLSPQRPEPYNHLGVLYLEMKRFDEAIDQFKKSVSLRPDYGEAFFNMAVAHYYRRDYQKAWDYVQKSSGLGYKVNPRLIEALRAHGVGSPLPQIPSQKAP